MHFLLLFVVTMMPTFAAAQVNPVAPITIGSTTFPMGERAFPTEAEFFGNVGNLALDPNLIDFIGPAQALIGHRLDYVVIDASNRAQWELVFGEPIGDDPGPDLMIGQAEFLIGGDGLRSRPALNRIDWRFPGGLWREVPVSAFTLDILAGVTSIFYADPNVKTDAFRLWRALVDIGPLPAGFGSTTTIEIRAHNNGANSPHRGTDLVIIGSLALSCGDVNGSGRVTALDAQAINLWLNGGPVPARPDLCDVGGAEACTATDSLIINRALIGLSPGIVQQCRGEAL
jgi:hypothetical protein